MSLLVKEQLHLIHGYIRRVDDILFGWIIPDSIVKLCSRYYITSMEYGHCSHRYFRSPNYCFVIAEPIFDVIGSKCTSRYLSIYAVFDGHMGRQCAEFCSINFTSILTKYLLTEKNINNAFDLCIKELDKKAIEDAADASGSSACIILIDKKTFDLWCCNIGDSRAIVINKDYTQAKQLSIEHKPEYPTEKQRIEAAYGWVTFGRTCGILAVSRALGDKDFKFEEEIENLIISNPDITHYKLKWTQDKCIVLASDGLINACAFTNEKCMEWIGKNIEVSTQESVEGKNATQQLAEKLVDDAAYVRQTKYNVAVIIIKLFTLIGKDFMYGN